MKYFCPIVLKNQTLTPFEIASGIELRELNQTEKEEFFGLERSKCVFSEKFFLGFVVFGEFSPSKKTHGRCPYSSLLQRGHFDGSSDILASRHVIIIDGQEEQLDRRVEQLNLTFKLLRPTSTGIYLLFKEGENDVGFHWNQVVHAPYDYLDLLDNDVSALQEICMLLEKCAQDKKFELCSRLYSRALYGDRSPLDLRFLLLLMALESLYLPDRVAELKFRLSLFVAKVLKLYANADPTEIYETVRLIYDVRSQIVHNGCTDKLTQPLFSQATELVRKSLLIYLSEKELFSKLEQLCLD